MKRRIALIGALLLAGCSSSAKLVPDDHAGPTAVIRDSSVNHAESGQAKAGHSQYFVVMAVDGQEVQNAFSQTFAGAEGFAHFKAHERKVPVRRMKVTLRAAAYFPGGLKGKGGTFGMDEISAAVVQNTVSFEPVAGETYVVRGRADERSAAAWIETLGGQRVTDTTVKKPGAAAQ